MMFMLRVMIISNFSHGISGSQIISYEKSCTAGLTTHKEFSNEPELLFVASLPMLNHTCKK